MSERLDALEARLAAVEAVAHPPINLRGVAMTVAETVAGLIERDPHTFVSSDCGTCKAVSRTLGRPFGCEAKR